MAGIYIHIPFCRKACHYCDFHFTVSFKNRDDILSAIRHEIFLQRNFFDDKTLINTIYFGGGTPSVLTEQEIVSILADIDKNFSLSADVEISLEANPDDLDKPYIEMLDGCGINRLSIGVQSLLDEHLTWMNRSHTANQARSAVLHAAEAGIKEISIDLIYGLPQLTVEQWSTILNEVFTWPINHLSSYSLTQENKTAYDNYVKKGLYKAPSNTLAVEHYNVLKEKINAQQWQQYEVSNFCKGENYSKHNTAYWQGKAYLGIGPSAHSYVNGKRSWNRSTNAGYVADMNSKDVSKEFEILSLEEKYNEYILTGLRTKWGISVDYIRAEFGVNFNDKYVKELDEFRSKKWLKITKDIICLSDEGMLFADGISSDLFMDYSSQISS